MTLICAAVGEDVFMPAADNVIQTLLNIQNSHLEAKDAQRIYLLSSW
jgi:hypothetical protein